jgi:hypothetical protein
MVSRSIDDHVLETFVSQKFHWKTLNHSQQMAMAVELMKHRYMERKLYRFLESVMEDREAWKKYRELLVEEARHEEGDAG